MNKDIEKESQDDSEQHRERDWDWRPSCRLSAQVTSFCLTSLLRGSSHPPPPPSPSFSHPLSPVFSLGASSVSLSLSTLPRIASLPASKHGLWWTRPCPPVACLQGRDSNGCLAKCSAIQRRCLRLSRYPASRLSRVVASHTSGCHMPRGRCLGLACCVTRCSSPFVSLLWLLLLFFLSY